MEFDAIVSPYDFADTYFPAFRSSVVDGKAKGVMCSYNSVNGIPACANTDLMKTLLRDALGFDGYITSDSGAVEAISARHHYTDSQCNAAQLAIEAGTDINSGKSYEACLEKLVESNKLKESVVNDALRHTLKLRFELGLFDPVEDQPYWNVTPSDVNTEAAKELSLNATRKSLVLLQNNGSVLPLPKGIKLAVVGPHVNSRRGLLGNYLGQMCHGDYNEVGCVQTPLEAVSASNGAANTTFATGCNITGNSTAGFDQAVALAKEADAVVLFLGIDTTVEEEVGDRDNIKLPSIQMQLLERVRAVGKPTVVVLINGGVIGAEDLIRETDALVEAFYPGFFGAQAMADVLFGDVNPSGKLPVTMYRSDYVDQVKMKSMDMTTYPGRTYRYYKEQPVFPFGWGLSYTTFSLSVYNGAATKESANTTVTSSSASSGSKVEGQSVGVSTTEVSDSVNATISVVVSNAGDVAGDEVVFAFFRPVRTGVTGPATLLNEQLLDYQRVSLEPSESRRVTFTLDRKALALVDGDGNLVSFPGSYEVYVTNGVHERLTFGLKVQGEQNVIQGRVQPFPQSGTS